MEELVKRIHRCAVYLPEKLNKNAELLDVLMKAADAIEELSKEVDKWKAKYAECFHHSMELFEENQNLQDVIRPLHEPRWIPVEEQLPEEGVSVQVCFRSQGGIAQAVSERFVNDRNQSYWSGLCGMKPTHWMPLPQAPKEE